MNEFDEWKTTPLCGLSIFAESKPFDPNSGDPVSHLPKKQLTIHVISGQQLPKPPQSLLGERGEVRILMFPSNGFEYLTCRIYVCCCLFLCSLPDFARSTFPSLLTKISCLGRHIVCKIYILFWIIFGVHCHYFDHSSFIFTITLIMISCLGSHFIL